MATPTINVNDVGKKVRLTWTNPDDSTNQIIVPAFVMKINKSDSQLIATIVSEYDNKAITLDSTDTDSAYAYTVIS